MNKIMKGEKYCSRNHFGWMFIILVFAFSLDASGQQKHMMQIKTFDQQLNPYKNIEVSVNGHDFVSVGNKGTGFMEIADSELPLKTIKIKNEGLEAASWNYSKGTLEIIVRPKSYQVAEVLIKDQNNLPVGGVSFTYAGKRQTTISSDKDGRIQIPLALNESLNDKLFSSELYSIVGLTSADGRHVLTVSKVGAESDLQETQPIGSDQKPIQSANEQLRNFDLTNIDSIQSLTMFYAVFKNSQISSLDKTTKRKLDTKFNQLMQQLQDSLERIDTDFIGKISDSSFVKDDVSNLLAQARQESAILENQKADFDEKIKLIQEKLESDLSNLDPGASKKLLADLAALEQLLSQNEDRFYKNQNYYRQIINSLKENFFNLEELENKLSQSEARRLEDQKIFRERLIFISTIVIVLGLLIVLLITFSNRLRKQKKALEHANAEIKHVNENLELLVAERTSLLVAANKELDTFLYRASHDLRSPVCSIIGLCNIATHVANPESKDLLAKVVGTTQIMDKLLKKLSIISEINQPSNYTEISLLELCKRVTANFARIIKEHNVNLIIDCSPDLSFHAYYNLVETVLTNLVENALFYSLMKDSANAKIELHARKRNGLIEISVRDNGIGVDRSMHTKLFDMFFKGHENSKGNGLGLYIVLKSVQALDGEIFVESEVDQYTQFTVQIPLKTANEKTTVNTPSQGELIPA